MKLKGVGFFEAHVEKLLLGLMVAVAAGVVVVQFTSTNAVEVGNQTLPPARAYDPVVRRAQEVDGQMSSTSPSIPEVDGRTQALAGVEERVKGAVSVRPEILALGKPAEIDEALFTGQAEDVEYAVVMPPAPSKPIVASYAGTLDPALLVENEALSAIVGPSQPFDIATVSVEVTYDGMALEEAFRRGGQGDIRAIPFNWFRTVEALGLQLERQEQITPGQWSEPTTINGLPGTQSLFELLQTETVAGNLSRDQLAADARQAYEQAIDYRRPLTLRTIAGTPWSPPSVVRQERAAQGGADSQLRANQINRQIAAERRTRETLETQVKEPDRGSGQDDRGPRGPGAPRGPGRPGGDPQTSPDDPRTQRLRDRIAEIDRRIAQLEEELIGLGYDPQTGQALAVAGFEDTTVDARLLEDSQARLWAHDATAEAGKTYRYRTRLAINNPLFGREPVLVESQRPLAAVPVVFSEPSPWSEPVVVAPRTAFFLTSATDGRGGALGPGEPSASIEVFTFFYGYYRRSTLTLRPGDLVVGEADLPDDLRLPVLASADPSGRMPDAEPGANPRGGSPAGTQPTGTPGQAGGQVAGQGEPVPDKVPAFMDVYLVDVTFEPSQAEGLGERTSRAVAYFSEVGGQGLMRRVASVDRQGALYQMVSRSAEEGRTQGQPRASLERVETQGPRGRDERPTGAAPATGGKGAGGGGGGG